MNNTAPVVRFPDSKPRVVPPPPAAPKPRGRIILTAPEITPQRLTRSAPFLATPQTYTFDRVQVDLTAIIPNEGLALIEDPTDAASLIFWSIVQSYMEIEADARCDEYSRRAFEKMSTAVSISWFGLRHRRQVTLLLKPDIWECVETIAKHFATDPQAVLRAALWICVQEKLEELRARRAYQNSH
jgi:hypothetical protein